MAQYYHITEKVSNIFLSLPNQTLSQPPVVRNSPYTMWTNNRQNLIMEPERSGTMNLIGTKLQTLRKNKNITQAQLATVLSVSSQSVSKWENHLSVPDISLLPVIARYFGITMDELFNYRLDALNYKV